MVKSDSATEMESIVFKGTASGKPVAQSIRVSIYLCPSAEAGINGPTISIDTLENGTLIIGILTRGTGLVLL
jgi:hypothetical protein